MIDVKDEILSDEPKYRIKLGDTILYDDLTIEMITPVTQEGTPLNKALFDSINTDIINRLKIEDKATLTEVLTQNDNEKYTTVYNIWQYMQSFGLPSKQLSIKTGTISNNSYIPKTDGYSNYLYFVSMNSFEGFDGMSNAATVCLKWQCTVNQTSRLVYARQKIYVTSELNPRDWGDTWNNSSTNNYGTNVPGQANYIEIAWN